jgi:hypothetical protein
MKRDQERGGTGYDELDWRLERYAAARLAPTEDSVRRMRRAVVSRAADIAAIREFEVNRLAEEAARRRTPAGAFDWLRTSLARRGAVAVLATSMVVGSTAGALAATPGSPLYPTRVWLESVFLPVGGEARAAAHVDHLEQRVEDAEHAAGGDDSAGVVLALAAYRAEMEQAIRDAAGDPARQAQLKAALDTHLLLLQQLEQSAPSDSQPAIHATITDGKAASTELEKSTKPVVTPAPAPAGPPGGGSDADGQNHQGDNQR